MSSAATVSPSLHVSLDTGARDLSKTTLALVTVTAVVGTGLAVGQGTLAGMTLVALVALAIVVLRYPVVGAYLLAGGVPVLSGLARGVPIPGLRPSEALVVFAGVLVLVPAFRRETPAWSVVDWAAMAYALASVALPVITMAARSEPISLSTISPTLLPLQFFVLYRTIRTALVTEEQRARALRYLLAASVVVSLIAVAQELDVGPTRDVVKHLTGSEALDSYGYSNFARATGPFQHWHPLAGYLAVIILVAVALLLEPTQRIMTRRGLLVVLAACVAALMLSVTFVSMFGVLMGVFALGLWAGRLGNALKWGVVVAAVSLLLFGSYVDTRFDAQFSNEAGASSQSIVPQTVQARIGIWTGQYLPAMHDRWMTGYGATLPPDVQWTHTESVYVTLLLRGGAPLLALFVVSMVTVSRSARSAARDLSRRPAARALAVLVGVLWIMQLLYPYLTSSGLPQPFWALAGIVLAGWQDRSVCTERTVV